MLTEILPPELLHEVRNHIYARDGYYVLRGFLQPEHTKYIVNHWQAHGNSVVLNRKFDKSKLFYDGCPNYTYVDGERRVHFNFFWNAPADALTYDSAWRIQRLRNQIEGNPASDNYLPMSAANLPKPAMTGVVSATSYRVVGTRTRGTVEPHKDWEHDPSKVQMSLVLSSIDQDYQEGGFLFRKSDGSLVNLSREENLQRGDLLVFRYCYQHGVAPVTTAGDQIGFWRMLFPIESIRVQRAQGSDGRSLHRIARWRSTASKVLRSVTGRNAAPVKTPGADKSVLEDAELVPIAQAAIDCGVSPSEVFYRKGLFARWQVMQRWQFEALRQLGLRPEHNFLDIGCGVLRLGMVLIPYLESGRYFGTDPVEAYVRTGHRLADAVLQTAKQYRLLVDHTFEFERFDAQFNFAMAHSVFTHMDQHEIEACLRRLRQVMAPGGKLLFTIALDRSLAADYRETFLYNADVPMVRTHHASNAFFERLAKEIGFRLEEFTAVPHPSQRALVATFDA